MLNKIRSFRKCHKLTQEELAGLVGVTRQTIIAIEAGRHDPSLVLAFGLSRVFGVRIEELFEYAEEGRGEKPGGKQLRGNLTGAPLRG